MKDKQKFIFFSIIIIAVVFLCVFYFDYKAKVVKRPMQEEPVLIQEEPIQESTDLIEGVSNFKVFKKECKNNNDGMLSELVTGHNENYVYLRSVTCNKKIGTDIKYEFYVDINNDGVGEYQFHVDPFFVDAPLKVFYDDGIDLIGVDSKDVLFGIEDSLIELRSPFNLIEAPPEFRVMVQTRSTNTQEIIDMIDCEGVWCNPF